MIHKSVSISQQPLIKLSNSLVKFSSDYIKKLFGIGMVKNGLMDQKCAPIKLSWIVYVIFEIPNR